MTLFQNHIVFRKGLTCLITGTGTIVCERTLFSLPAIHQKEPYPAFSLAKDLYYNT